VAPFFSIAVPTFDRHDLLRETLASLLAQDFADFEVLVGNDYTAEVLSGELLGVNDPRIRFINHPRNLREVGNMNALLAAATGRYFTWVFDDDLIEPGFLRAAHDILTERGCPPALFPRYRVLTDGAPYVPVEVVPGVVTRYTGREFLANYFSGRLEVISTTAFFATELFRTTVCGVEELCDSVVGLYCEYLLLVRCALLGEILCVDAPYVVFRAHAESWGASNTELHKYLQGGERLLRRSAAVLRRPDLRPELERSLLGLSRIHLAKLCFVAMRAEAAAPTFGPAAIARAFAVVTGETAKIRNAVVAEGCDKWRARAVFARLAAKSVYLLAFSWFYYGRRRRARELPAAPVQQR
jgi:glycosyltransferase involved in cell wall biosynthesis